MLPIGHGIISPFAGKWPQWKTPPGGEAGREGLNRAGSRVLPGHGLAVLWRHTARTVASTAWPVRPAGPHNGRARFASLPTEAPRLAPLLPSSARTGATSSRDLVRGEVLVRPSTDPAWRERAVRAQDLAMAEIAARRGMTLEAYRDAVNAHIARLLGDAHLFVRVPGGVLLDLLRAGRWATRLEGLANSVAPSLRTRAIREHILFGTPRADHAPAPGYGYLAGPDGTHRHSYLRWYGGVALRLHDRLRCRASFIIGDTADYAGRGGFVPQPLNDLREAYRANLYRWDPDYGDVYAREHPDLLYSPDPLDHTDLERIMPYVEFQLHAAPGAGPVPLELSDIAEVIMLDDRETLFRSPRNAFRSVHEADGLLQALNGSGLAWRGAPGVDLTRRAAQRIAASRPPAGEAARRAPADWLQRATPQAVAARRIATHRLYFLPHHPGRLVKVNPPTLVDPDGARPAAETAAALLAELDTYRAHRAMLGRYLGAEHLVRERSFVMESLPFAVADWPQLRDGSWTQAAHGVVAAPAIVRVQDRLPAVRDPHFHFMYRSGMQQSFPAANDLAAACALWLRDEGGRFDADLFERVERTMSSFSDLLRVSRERLVAGQPGLRESMRHLVSNVIRFVNDTGWRPYLYTRALFVVSEGRWTYKVQDGLHDCFARPSRVGDATATIAAIRDGEAVGPEAFGAAIDEVEYALSLNAMSQALGEEARIALPGASLLDARFAQALLALWERESWEMGWDYDVSVPHPGRPA